MGLHRINDFPLNDGIQRVLDFIYHLQTGTDEGIEAIMNGLIGNVPSEPFVIISGLEQFVAGGLPYIDSGYVYDLNDNVIRHVPQYQISISYSNVYLARSINYNPANPNSGPSFSGLNGGPYNQVTVNYEGQLNESSNGSKLENLQTLSNVLVQKGVNEGALERQVSLTPFDYVGNYQSGGVNEPTRTGYWVDPFGRVHLHGYISSGGSVSSGDKAIQNLPAPVEPIVQVVSDGFFYGGGIQKVFIETNGDLRVTWSSSLLQGFAAGRVSANLEGINYLKS